MNFFVHQGNLAGISLELRFAQVLVQGSQNIVFVTMNGPHQKP